MAMSGTRTCLQGQSPCAGVCAVASAVTIDGPLTIVGKKTAALGAPTLTTTAVGPRILNVHPGAADDVVTLRGLRLTGSTETSDQSGGAIIVLTGTLVLRDVRIDDVTRSYHVPLLLAPYGVTSYRGS